MKLKRRITEGISSWWAAWARQEPDLDPAKDAYRHTVTVFIHGKSRDSAFELKGRLISANFQDNENSIIHKFVDISRTKRLDIYSARMFIECIQSYDEII